VNGVLSETVDTSKMRRRQARGRADKQHCTNADLPADVSWRSIGVHMNVGCSHNHPIFDVPKSENNWTLVQYRFAQFVGIFGPK
jgi:hypothetical protein